MKILQKLVFVFAAVSPPSLLASKPSRPLTPTGATSPLLEHLTRERDLHMKELRSIPGLRSRTMQLLSLALVDVNQAPKNPLKVSDWGLRISWPRRQASSELWISLCELKYEEKKRVLRDRFDQLRKKTDPRKQEELIAAFSLAQAIVASEFLEGLPRRHASLYPKLDMSGLAETAQAP